MARWLWRVFLAAALGLGALGAAAALRDAPPEPSSEPALVVERPEREVGRQEIGETELIFPITNRSERPALIVGLVEG